MADEQTTDTNDGGAPKQGGMSKKLLIVIIAIMVLEGVAVVGVLKLTGAPPSASASDIEGEAEADQESLVEIPLIEDRFQNMQSGRVWLWETEIQLKVKNRNKALVEKRLERRRAEIHEGISLIFRRAQDRHLKEPGLETITRQLNRYVEDVFGVDADGLPRVERVIIPKCKGFPADF